jgi:hypothetical protein
MSQPRNNLDALQRQLSTPKMATPATSTGPTTSKGKVRCVSINIKYISHGECAVQTHKTHYYDGCLRYAFTRHIPKDLADSCS